MRCSYKMYVKRMLNVQYIKQNTEIKFRNPVTFILVKLAMNFKVPNVLKRSTYYFT